MAFSTRAPDASSYVFYEAQLLNNCRCLVRANLPDVEFLPFIETEDGLSRSGVIMRGKDSEEVFLLSPLSLGPREAIKALYDLTATKMNERRKELSHSTLSSPCQDSNQGKTPGKSMVETNPNLSNDKYRGDDDDDDHIILTPESHESSSEGSDEGEEDEELVTVKSRKSTHRPRRCRNCSPTVSRRPLSHPRSHSPDSIADSFKAPPQDDSGSDSDDSGDERRHDSARWHPRAAPPFYPSSYALPCPTRPSILSFPPGPKLGPMRPHVSAPPPPPRRVSPGPLPISGPPGLFRINPIPAKTTWPAVQPPQKSYMVKLHVNWTGRGKAQTLQSITLLSFASLRAAAIELTRANPAAFTQNNAGTTTPLKTAIVRQVHIDGEIYKVSDCPGPTIDLPKLLEGAAGIPRFDVDVEERPGPCTTQEYYNASQYHLTAGQRNGTHTIPTQQQPPIPMPIPSPPSPPSTLVQQQQQQPHIPSAQHMYQTQLGLGSV